ncbi:hypothetical protein [Spirosoma sp.]|uniref:hypothetical protein n=1 Tax=Spirosoma sp. TaxID=1899569 RepID=UPI003B3A2FDA
MKTLPILLLVLSVSLVLSCSSKDTIAPSDKVSDTQVIGRWNLARITNGFGQTSYNPAETGTSETIDFNPDGTFHRLSKDKLGQQEEKGNYYTGPNPTQTVEKQAIFYPDDKTVQPYSFRDGRLFLYQRGSQDATIADGSTYEYQRQ